MFHNRTINKMTNKDTKKAYDNTFLYVISWICCVVCCFIALTIRWGLTTWANLTVDELLYHMTTNLEGTGADVIRSCVLTVVLPTVCVGFVLLGLFLYSSRNGILTRRVIGIDAIFLLLMLISVCYGWHKLDLSGYIKAQTEDSDFIEQHYVDPKDVTLTFPKKKRNLIYIFLESTEMTYADESVGGAFSFNPIAPLVDLSHEGVDFSGDPSMLNGGYVLPGSTWTIAGMFTETTGLPLKAAIDGNSMNTQKHFFSGVTALGDILSEEGYQQTLMIGSDADFGGRLLYFTEHGNYTIKDYNYAEEQGLIPKGYKVGNWGYEDQKLFTFAKEELLELASQEQPFNLTLLTVDTHFEDGILCSQCEDDTTYGDDQYSTVFACNSRQIKEFVSWIQEQDFYNNTTIILCGDHLTMDSDYTEDVDPSYDRRVYTNIINPSNTHVEEVERQYTTLDVFPTTLASLGVEIEGDQLGLGVNLYSKKKTLLEEYDYHTLETEFKAKSTFMDSLADIEETEELKELEAGMTIQCDMEVTDDNTVTIRKIHGQKTHPEQVGFYLAREADQSDEVWIEMDEIQDRVYQVKLDPDKYHLSSGTYQIRVYIAVGTGKQFPVEHEITEIEIP